jgi:hypothetical protein
MTKPTPPVAPPDRAKKHAGGPHPKKPVVLLGKTFASQAEAASYFGVSQQALGRRLKAGWAPEAVVGIKKHQRQPPGNAVVTSLGSFRSIAEAARHAGVAQATVQARLSDGWSPDEALGITPHRRKPKTTEPIDFSGQKYPNLVELSRAYGLKGDLVRKRLKNGWTLEQALELTVAPPRFRNQIGGQRDRVWKEVAIIDAQAYPCANSGSYKLYAVVNKIDGKQYVGITISPLWVRFNGHKATAKKGVKSKLYNAMRSHGVHNFSI